MKMGVAISILRKVYRPIKNFDVENRAFKVISKDKPVRAPVYKADQETLDKVLKDNPNLIEELSRKSIGLDARLKEVYVSSTDILPIEPIKISDNRPLPLSRKVVLDHDYGTKEPEIVSEGYVTLRGAIQFLNDHKDDKELHSPSNIAKSYKLDHQAVENIIKYYSSFELFVPKRLTEQEKAWTQRFLQRSDKA